MKSVVVYDTDCLIYPGAYVPLLHEEDVLEELKHSHENEMALPPANVTELAGLFKVEVAIPGLKKEDFLIHADGNILSICAVHNKCGLSEVERIQQHEFNYECFDRLVILPESADPDFTSAEYTDGILRIYVPKSTLPTTKLHTRIVVY